MLFFAIVAAPVLRRIEPPDLRAALFRRLGESFRRVGWIAIGVLLATGVANLAFRGWLRPIFEGHAVFWGSAPGRSLLLKLFCVAAMIAISVVHDFVLGPRSVRSAAGSDDALRLRRNAAWLARVNALIGVLLVYVSVRLARGG
jgi:putative copper export protein